MKQSSKRLLSVFLAFLLITGAFICFFDLVQPTYNDMQALRSKQLGEESYLADQTALVKQVQLTLNTYQNETQGAANVGLAMPSGADVAGAIAQIQGIAGNNAIALGSISLTPPTVQIQTAAPGASASSASRLMKPLGSFALRFAAAGSYEGFKNFLSEVETNIRIFDVQSISLQPAALASTPAPVPTKIKAGSVPTSTPANDQFNYAVTVATYYQTQ